MDLHEVLIPHCRDPGGPCDQTYLNGLSRDALLEALETELQFLGFYSHGNQETPVVIRDFLEREIDEWWPRDQSIESPLSATTLSMSTGPLEAQIFYRSNFFNFVSGEEAVPTMRSDVSPIAIGLPETEEAEPLFFNFTSPERQASDTGLQEWK